MRSDLSHRGRGDRTHMRGLLHRGTLTQRGVTGGGVAPALGTEPRRAAACADAALSPKVALAISPMPASDPKMLIASIGSMMIFWFGESASWPNALMYLSIMK